MIVTNFMVTVGYFILRNLYIQGGSNKILLTKKKDPVLFQQ